MPAENSVGWSGATTTSSGGSAARSRAAAAGLIGRRTMLTLRILAPVSTALALRRAALRQHLRLDALAAAHRGEGVAEAVEREVEGEHRVGVDRPGGHQVDGGAEGVQ